MHSIHLSFSQNDFIISGLFRNFSTAEKAYQTALACGYTQHEINIFIVDSVRKEYLSEFNNPISMQASNNANDKEFNGIYTALTVLENHLVHQELGLIAVGPLINHFKKPRNVTDNLMEILIGCNIPESEVRKYELGLLIGGIVIGVAPDRKKNNAKLKHTWKKLNVDTLKLVIDKNQMKHPDMH